MNFKRGVNPYKNYNDYIMSDIWKLKRDTMVEQNPNCIVCKKNKRLQVHHLSYFNLGNESSKDLLVVCKKCHKKIHLNKCPIPEFNFDNTKESNGEW